jgi:osmoprotectant transport system substrate-binding protein
MKRTCSVHPAAVLPLFAFIAWSMLAACGVNHRTTIVVGSKNFTEQAILGELLAQQIESHTRFNVMRRFYLTGTYICQQAILTGRIDMYVEYTGTALTAILKDPIQSDPGAVFAQVQSEYARRFHLDVLPSLGFDNTFAIVVRGEDARRDHLKTISDLARIASRIRAGFGYEFMERPDGYDGLARTYDLHFPGNPRIMDLGLLYRALLEKQVDVVAGSATDGLLAARDFTILEDDKHYFPPYQAVPIVREHTLDQHPQLRTVIEQLAGKISNHDMQQMNYAVDGLRKDPAVVARDFLKAKALE